LFQVSQSAIQNQMPVDWAVKWAPNKAEPSEILRLGSRMGAQPQPQPCFRQEMGLGGEMGIKSGRQKAVKEPCQNRIVHNRAVLN
jgi:hypothetical protein